MYEKKCFSVKNFPCSKEKTRCFKAKVIRKYFLFFYVNEHKIRKKKYNKNCNIPHFYCEHLPRRLQLKIWSLRRTSCPPSSRISSAPPCHRSPRAPEPFRRSPCPQIKRSRTLWVYQSCSPWSWWCLRRFRTCWNTPSSGRFRWGLQHEAYSFWSGNFPIIYQTL